MAVNPPPGVGKFSNTFNKMASPPSTYPSPSPPSFDSSGNTFSDDESRMIQGLGGNIVVVSTPDVKETKHTSSQDTIDEFWAKFKSKTPGKGSS